MRLIIELGGRGGLSPETSCVVKRASVSKYHGAKTEPESFEDRWPVRGEPTRLANPV